MTRVSRQTAHVGYSEDHGKQKPRIEVAESRVAARTEPLYGRALEQETAGAHQSWQGGPSIPNIVLFHLPIDRCPLSLVSTWRGGKKEWVERLGAQKYT